MDAKKFFIGLGAVVGFAIGGGWVWLLSESALAGLGGGVLGGVYLGPKVNDEYDD